MTLFQIVLLAVIQGLTEFLPISSSAHLIFPSALLGFPDQGLAFDVAVHVGTLSAVVWYLKSDIVDIVGAWLKHCFQGIKSRESSLGWMIILGTIPAGLAGLLLNDFIELHLRSIVIIAVTTIFFGILLGVADRYSSQSRSMNDLGWRATLCVGLAQALALIPGTSRSGITMAAALALGFDRISAARFSFLLSIPIIFLSGCFKGVELVSADTVPWLELILGTVVSALTAYACIHVFLKWVSRIGMMPFVWYRLLLGGFLLAMIGLDVV